LKEIEAGIGLTELKEIEVDRCGWAKGRSRQIAEEMTEICLGLFSW
jgi:hypothetical protein